MLWPTVPHCCCHDSDVLLLIDASTANEGNDPWSISRCIRKRAGGGGKGCLWAVADYKTANDDGYASGWNLRQTMTADRSAVLDAIDASEDAAGGETVDTQQLDALAKAADEWTASLGGRSGVPRLVLWHGNRRADTTTTTISEAKSSLDGASIDLFALNASVDGSGIDIDDQAGKLVSESCRLLHGATGLGNAQACCRRLHALMCPLFLRA
jgi:hypothetical protein